MPLPIIRHGRCGSSDGKTQVRGKAGAKTPARPVVAPSLPAACNGGAGDHMHLNRTKESMIERTEKGAVKRFEENLSVH